MRVLGEAPFKLGNPSRIHSIKDINQHHVSGLVQDWNLLQVEVFLALASLKVYMQLQELDPDYSAFY